MSQVSLPSRRARWSWFSVARILILAQVLAGVIFTILHLPDSYQNLRDLVPGIGFQGWTQAQLQSAAQAVGIAPGVLAPFLFGLDLLGLLCFWGMAALLAWRRSDSWIGLLVIYILAGTAPGFTFSHGS